MAAVNPYFWTEWKAYLFQDVYTKTRDHLRGIRGYYLNISDIKLKELVEDMPDRYLISNTIDTINADYQMIMKAKDKRPVIAIEEKTARISAHISDGSAEITIAANNMPGLFTTIVGVLGFRGLNILRARLYTGKSGIVIDKILISNWRDMWWQGMEDQIKEELKKAILSGEDTRIQGLKGEKKNILLEHMKPRTIKPFFRFESFVEIDNETSDKYTILELFSPDRLGLLYDISSQLYKYDVEIISAVINTEDRVAQDVFYLQYNNGKLNADVTMNVLYAAWSVIE
jgi:[protein-PII] uridylyltransferase